MSTYIAQDHNIANHVGGDVVTLRITRESRHPRLRPSVSEDKTRVFKLNGNANRPATWRRTTYLTYLAHEGVRVNSCVGYNRILKILILFSFKICRKNAIFNFNYYLIV